jgi:prophage regulatory protein
MRIYLWKDLRAAGVPYTRKHVRTLQRRGEFPMHFNLGPNRVAWLAAEVDAWVEERVRHRRNAPTPSTSEFPEVSRRDQSVAEIARLLKEEAACRGVTTVELIRRIIKAHGRAAAEPALNT